MEAIIQSIPRPPEIQNSLEELVFCAPSPELRGQWLAAFRDLLTLAKKGGMGS